MGLKYIFVTMLLTLLVKSTTSDVGCHYYNETECITGCQEKIDSCPLLDTSPDEPTCFVVWSNKSHTNDSFTIKVMNKGCWTEPKDCHENCIDDKPVSRDIRFCCCRGHLCNANFRFEPLISVVNSTIDTADPQFLWIVSSSVSSLFIIVLVFSVCFYFRRKRNRSLNGTQYEMPTQDDALRQPLQNHGNDKNGVIDLDKVELLCQIASGRYGSVHKGHAQSLITGEKLDVAVKISSPQEFQALQNEQQVYCLPQMRHNNILKFYCSEKRIDNDGLNFSLWLVTEYMEKGSLHDYLSTCTITWKEVLMITQGIACGMQHLHEDIIATNEHARKPAVAHRDFKSKNVLLKPDLTPCIADFGLAYIFYPDQPVSTKHGQIGTRRYMAPEILGGSIGFTADAFIKIDMYAVGLVMWELISRCVINESIKPTGPYMLPYEREAGPVPTIETMHKIVCLERTRPTLRHEWHDNSETELFCKSIEESWDNDPEARSSAANIYERVKKMLSRYPSSSSSSSGSSRQECDSNGEDLE